LRKLQRLGLIEVVAEKSGIASRYTLNTKSFRQLIASWHVAQEPAFSEEEIAIDERVFDATEQEILRRFFHSGRLTTIPAGRRQLEVVIKWFAQLFEVGTTYQEKEVNATIQRHYHDYAFFKKDLVGRGFLRREQGLFKRVIP
jgi:hypothetical protein